MINSMDSFDKWWLKCLQTGKITINDIDWPQCILPQDVHDCYVDHCHRERERHPVTFHAFFRRLNKICPGYRLRKMNQGSGRENYSCFPYLEVCRQFFVDKIGITVDWTDDEVPF